MTNATPLLGHRSSSDTPSSLRPRVRCRATAAPAPSSAVYIHTMTDARSGDVLAAIVEAIQDPARDRSHQFRRTTLPQHVHRDGSSYYDITPVMPESVARLVSSGPAAEGQLGRVQAHRERATSVTHGSLCGCVGCLDQAVEKGPGADLKSSRDGRRDWRHQARATAGACRCRTSRACPPLVAVLAPLVWHSVSSRIEWPPQRNSLCR